MREYHAEIDILPSQMCALKEQREYTDVWLMQTF